MCTGKGSSQGKHKHKHKGSRVSPSRAEPTIVGTLHTPPSLADAKRWRRRGILGYAAFAATGVEGNDVFRPGSLGELANFSSEYLVVEGGEVERQTEANWMCIDRQYTA